MGAAADCLGSPRIAALHAACLAGDRGSLERFWREIEAAGAPLVEPDPEDEGYALVTFLWRAGTPTNDMRVIQDWGGTNRLEQQLPLRRLLETDLWYGTRRLKADTRLLYQMNLNDPRVPWSLADDPAACAHGWQRDPLNPRACQVIREDAERGSADLYFSQLELPGAPAQPYLAARPEAPAGEVRCERLRSAVLGNERRVWTYVSPQTPRAGEDYALLVVLDGKEYIDLIPTPTILDNLLAAGLIPPLVAVFPDSLGWGVRGQELTCNPDLLNFLSEELLPWLAERCAFTSDPARSVIAGSSLGGLAAAYIGLKRSARFGQVLAQSGAFAWAPEGEDEAEWLARQYAQQPRGPLRFYQEVGALEADAPAEGVPSPLLANRHMRTVLQAKGYAVHYREYSGGHDFLNLQGTLADGLIALLAAP